MDHEAAMDLDDHAECHDCHVYYATPDEDCDDCAEANQEMWQRMMASY